MREELVAKRYLCAKIAGPLILEYYLLVSPLAEDLEIYGVKIVERRSGVTWHLGWRPEVRRWRISKSIRTATCSSC